MLIRIKFPVTIILIFISLIFFAIGFNATQDCEGSNKTMCELEVANFKTGFLNTELRLGPVRPAFFSHLRLIKMTIFFSAGLITLMVGLIISITKEKPYIFLIFLGTLFLPNTYSVFMIFILATLVSLSTIYLIIQKKLSSKQSKVYFYRYRENPLFYLGTCFATAAVILMILCLIKMWPYSSNIISITSNLYFLFMLTSFFFYYWRWINFIILSEDQFTCYYMGMRQRYELGKNFKTREVDGMEIIEYGNHKYTRHT